MSSLNSKLVYGGLIESGSNANGSYEKYADGRLVQYGTLVASSGSFAATGNIFYRDIAGVTFPIPFITTPKYAAATCQMGNIGSTMLTGLSPTRINNFYITSSVSTPRAIDIFWEAKGRWK